MILCHLILPILWSFHQRASQTPLPWNMTHVMMTTGQVTYITTTTDSLLHTTLIINEPSLTTHYSLFVYLHNVPMFPGFTSSHGCLWKITAVYSTPTRGQLPHRMTNKNVLTTWVHRKKRESVLDSVPGPRPGTLQGTGWKTSRGTKRRRLSTEIQL